MFLTFLKILPKNWETGNNYKSNRVDIQYAVLTVIVAIQYKYDRPYIHNNVLWPGFMYDIFETTPFIHAYVMCNIIIIL